MQKHVLHFDAALGEWRRYYRDFADRACGRARYIKEVYAIETTIRLAQEIYDPAGRVMAVHEKFPVDLGHKQM